MSDHIKGLMHNGRRWDIVRIKGSYFARCYGQGEYAGKPSDTGPYSTMEQAQEFIQAIVPAPVSSTQVASEHLGCEK